MRHPVKACATSRSLTQPRAASRSLTSRGLRTLFNQSERGYSVRHGVYVTGDTYAVLTNQSTGIAYVTACTYAFLMRVRPLNMCAPPPAPSRPLKKKARSAPILLLIGFSFQHVISLISMVIALKTWFPTC